MGRHRFAHPRLGLRGSVQQRRVALHGSVESILGETTMMTVDEERYVHFTHCIEDLNDAWRVLSAIN